MKKRDRLAFTMFLLLLLSGADGSAVGEDGPMAHAPLPPPLPVAEPGTSLRQPQGGNQSQAPRQEPQSRPRAERGRPVAHLPQRNRNAPRLDRVTLRARGEKRRGRGAVGDVVREEARADAQVARTAIPLFAPPPPAFWYNPGAPPPYGYAPVYPPPWPPGPALPR